MTEQMQVWAHDFAMNVVRSGIDYVSIDNLAVCAFEYAEAMQAQLDKRKAPELDLDTWQPDWSKAPEWANWCAVGSDGVGYWCEYRPYGWDDKFLSKGLQRFASSFKYTGDWRKSLRKRPSND